MRTLLALLATAALAGPAFAQQPGVPVPGAAQAQSAAPAAATPAGPADVRVNQLIIYGDDPCPESTDPNEITVCARLPDSDRYRVPPNLRDNPNEPGSNSWANRATELSYVGRTGTDSCSTVGGGGFTGCFNQIVSQARAERRAAGTDFNFTRMIEEARARRDRQIEEQAQQAEEDAQRNEAATTPAPQPVP
ncbi:MAG TPA: hypothetical protein VEC11_00755 [Allosphingosinicella sp.]|nr:hypothetical protein [Allosphingosinicella sp.]